MSENGLSYNLITSITSKEVITQSLKEGIIMSWTFIRYDCSDTTVYDEIAVYDELGNIVCTLSIDEDIDEDDQEEYEGAVNNNARLISAAPDLLKALEELVKSYPDHDPSISKALAAIKKAKGE